ncbi:hypothetical protein QBC37DRAFT_298206 [Rhypophila decipiens]|uniref:Uncharacterized protein n=1 Tax=Rhypophila decipiens TaxID=261697 RepID=A0AAN7B010_9PEZI|nr:hypothetical protein QBC37DRAFT_298206 [Rhypophila decipiens]
MRLPWTELGSSAAKALVRRHDNGTDTVSSLVAQWANPTDVSTILMVIGGDVVQKALAQGTGKMYTPVCFSFGCVAYTFTALVGIMGDGRLLPPPDYPVKVFNLKSGYGKENRNWVLGRILRDLETQLAKELPGPDDETAGSYGIQISVWEALDNHNRPTQFSWGRLHCISLAITLVQFAIAAVPALSVVGGDWSVLFITAVGTVLIQAIGILPQWVAEKLTTGNGSRDIVVIIGGGKCLDLEEMANAELPRKAGVWLKFRQHILSRRRQASDSSMDSSSHQQRQSRFVAGFPFGFWLTRVVIVVTSVLSLLLLINLAVPKDYGWFILLIGGIGMFQNGVLAGRELPLEVRNLPLRRCEVLGARKVMDGIMDFDSAYPGFGACLLREFFPGPLYEAEERWWRGDFEPYEKVRMDDEATRGTPRRLLQAALVQEHGGEVERTDGEREGAVEAERKTVATANCPSRVT